jgi:glycosyltransferase involved in cell wall biosynthesis
MWPLVSILIPGFNAEPWIKQTVESAISQDYPRKEVIIVDDGSTDQTLEIARTFESSSVRVFTQPNLGAPAARNKALAHAQGEYIQWLDADDLLAATKITNQMKECERVQNERVLFSCPFASFYSRWNKARLFQSRLYRDLTPSDYFLIKFSYDVFLQPSSWLVSRKLSDLAGPWWELAPAQMEDGSIVPCSPDDDGEYFCRVVAASEGIHFVPEARCYWRIGNQESLSGSWQRSPRHLEALFQTTKRSMEHYGKLENSERSRAARIAFLQNRLIYFYPDRLDIMKQISVLAEELGGEISPPALGWKYQYIKAAFGWPAAKRCRFAVPDVKHSMKRRWDHLLYELERSVHRQKS